MGQLRVLSVAVVLVALDPGCAQSVAASPDLALFDQGGAPDRVVANLDLGPECPPASGCAVLPGTACSVCADGKCLEPCGIADACPPGKTCRVVSIEGGNSFHGACATVPIYSRRYCR
jgi:hypothetical protein